MNIWDTNTGRRLHRTLPLDVDSTVKRRDRFLVAWGPDSRSYVYGSEDLLSFWRMPQTSVLKTLLPHSAYVKTMHYSAERYNRMLWMRA